MPGDLVGIERFKEVYSHPAAGGRSKGAALSDLFWYWLAPGPEMHQEHLEAGERYDAVARATRGFLSVPRTEAEELTRRCVTRTLREARGLVRLRDLMMPLWAEFSYELVFGRPCPRTARDLIVGNANDVVTALKCCGLRHMARRDRLTRYLMDRLPLVRQPLPEGLSAREQALYLQGAFFNTAVVQLSEAMAHLLMVLAQHPDVQARASTGRPALPGPGDLGDAAALPALRHRPPRHHRRHHAGRAHGDPGRLGAVLQLPRVPPRWLHRPRPLRPRAASTPTASTLTGPARPAPTSADRGDP